MKKLYLSGLLMIITVSLYAQMSVVNFTVTQPPCANDGIVTGTWTGGTAPYSLVYHFWSTGTQITHSGVTGNSDQLTGWDGSPFNVLITDANGITNDGAQQSEYPFEVSSSVTNIQCPSTPGSITTTVTGGTAPYTYQYYNSEDLSTVISSTNPAQINDEGFYWVRITDANGCTMLSQNGNANGQTDTGIFVHSVAPFEFNVSTTVANCTNGTATPGTISGTSTAPLSYLWSNGSTSSTGLTGLVMGNYVLTITDAQGCHFTRNFNIEQAVDITVNTTPTAATCQENDGSAIAFGSGGMPPYSYQWSNGFNNQNNTNLNSGLYSVNVTDANGCTGSGSVFINASTPITATYTATPSSCTAATGSATLTISGGQTPYNIVWNTSPGQTGVTANNLAAGSYGFSITDANGCLRTGTAVVPPQNEVNVFISKTNPNCIASDGSATAYVSGTGATPYTYLWSNGATSSNISAIPAGNYSVTVTDNDGCHKSAYTNLEAQSPISLGFSTIPVTCMYATNGSITVNANGGTAPYTYNWSNPSLSGNNITGIGTGQYYVTVSDASGCTASGHTIVGNSETDNSCYCTISGIVYEDANENCVQDASENGIQNIGIHCQGFGTAYTDATGHYAFHVPTGDYNVSETVQYLYPLSSCQNNNFPISVTASAGCTQTVDFANVINPLHDMRISLWNNNFPVPGNNHIQQLEITNAGTVPESAALASYSDDGQTGMAYFNPSVVFVNGGGNFYSSGASLGVINPGESQIYNVSHAVPTNIPLGTSLLYFDSVANASSIAANWLNDYSPWNNVNTVTQPVVGSFDPNFIEVSPQGVGADGNIESKDSILEYRIHFQNTGSYYAQNIFVLNPLDANLDWSTFKPGAGSFPFTTTMSEDGTVRFQLDNINLPWQDMSEAGSQGYVTYTVHLKPNLSPGTQIHNNAGIYFDFNEPVITNQVLNTLIEITSIHDEKLSQATLRLYPNPAQNNFTIMINSLKKDEGTITVTDITGKIIMKQAISVKEGNQSLHFDAAQLAGGVYFVSLKGNSFKNTEKLVIVK